MSESEERSIVIRPVTGLLAVLSIAATLWWWMGGDVSRITLDYRVWSQPWRMFTSVLPHVGLLHLVFNVYWLQVFGGRVEAEFGSIKTAAIYLCLGIGSSLAEYAVARSGVGLSGIGYGLFGFLWVLSRYDTRFTGAITSQVVLLFVFWFFLCIVLTVTGVWHVGNIAHGVGAVLGCVLGWCVIARTSDARIASRLLLGGGFIVVVLAASVGRPHCNLTEDVGDEYAYLGYQALVDGNAPRAVRYLQKAVDKKPGDSETWFNLGIAYYRCQRFEDAVAAYQRAIEVSPSNELYRTALSELEEYVSATQ